MPSVVIRPTRIGFNIVYSTGYIIRAVDYVKTHLYNDPFLGSVLAVAW